MTSAQFSLQEDYWESFELTNDDVEFLYNHLIETETPLTTAELLIVLVEDRVRRERKAIDERRSAGGEIYLPKNSFASGQALIFPALGWQKGEVVAERAGRPAEGAAFRVIEVSFDEGPNREFVVDLEEHGLNLPGANDQDMGIINAELILEDFGKALVSQLEAGLGTNEEFVRIAGRWFPRALLVDINAGHLNLAEAVLDMEGGGPLATRRLLETLEMPGEINERLLEFSLDYALWKDPRFDEVGPAGQILWYLERLEPREVSETPHFLTYHEPDHDRTWLLEEMLGLEQDLDDELSPFEDSPGAIDEVEIEILFPHWRVGSLPLSARLRPLFPTAYQAPHIRFVLVDGDTGEKFPGWVVRKDKYVFGLRDYYENKGVIPGSLIKVRRGEQPGEVIVDANVRRPIREWVRTVLVGADSAIVLAMLKQIVATRFDDRMAIAVPELENLDAIWEIGQGNRKPFEQSVVDTLRELGKLNPQGHVHISELYAAVNLVRRCPPGPIMALLASRSWFVHVGDLHFRFNDSESI